MSLDTRDLEIARLEGQIDLLKEQLAGERLRTAPAPAQPIQVFPPPQSWHEPRPWWTDLHFETITSTGFKYNDNPNAGCAVNPMAGYTTTLDVTGCAAPLSLQWTGGSLS